MTTTYGYATAQQFFEYLGFIRRVPSTTEAPGSFLTTWENTGTGDGTEATYYLDAYGVLPASLQLKLADGTDLTLTTDYTFDADTSGITLTSTGATAADGQVIYASYNHAYLGGSDQQVAMSESEAEALLNRAEEEINDGTGTFFADQSASAPLYNQLVNELHYGQGQNLRGYDTDYYPLVKLQTTVNGAYTTGGSSIVLTDASGFPSTGTIYVGGNKVTYSAKSSHTLTIPATTPSIADGAVVRGEVVEIALESEGAEPTFQVLVPDTQYAVDYDTGEVRLLDDFLIPNASLLGNVQPMRGVANRVRVTYCNAWHQPGRDCTIPLPITQLTLFFAARLLKAGTFDRAHIGALANFNPQLADYTDAQIERLFKKYSAHRVSDI